MSLIAVLAADLAGTVRVDAENRQAVLSYDEGMQALLRQDDEKALAAFQRAVALEPSLANAHYALGMLYKKQERWTEGVRAFQHAITADANYIEPYCELGGVYLEALAQVAEATLLLQKAIQVDPHHARARQLLGTAYLRQNRADAAIQELQRAVELNPSDTQALYLLGLAYLQQGKFDAASLRLKQTVEQNPFHAKAYFSLGNCYMRMGRAEEGQEALRTFERLSLEEEQMTHLKRLVREAPSNVEGWYQLGRLQMGWREWDAATTAFEKCIALNPQEARGYDALGYIYFQTKAYGKALEMYSGLVQRYPDVATYRNSLGSVYLMMDKYPQAIAQFQTAIHLDPSEPRFHLHLSKAYEQAGEGAKAEEEYHRYQSLKSPEK